MSTNAVHGTQPVQQSSPNSTANRFLHAAMGYYKAAPPYVFGGGHSGAQQGYGSVDCSGLVIQSLYKAGVSNPDNLVSTAGLPGQTISRGQLQPGDLCYKHGSGAGGHVAIYIGDNKILESYSSGKPPRIRELGNPDEFTDFRRIFNQTGNVVNTNGVSVQPASGGSVGAPSGGGVSMGAASTAGGSADSSGVSGGGSPSGLSLPSGGNSFGGASASSAPSSGAPVGPPPSGNVSEWIQQAIKILESMGIPASEINANDINTIIQHESGGDPHAQNNTDSNAAAGHPSKGLMQTIDSTFNAYAAKGHTDIWNPVDNIVAGVHYAISRYGSLSNVPGIKAVAAGGSYVGY